MQEENRPSSEPSKPIQESNTNPPIQNPGVGSTPISSEVVPEPPTPQAPPPQGVASGTVDPIPSSKPPVQSSGENTSGQGSSAVIPEEVKGWSWGGFFLSWIWGTFNGVTISIIALIVPFMNIVLGIKGREWAWQSKRWDSVEHFNQTQRKWAIAGALWVVIWVVISIILPVILFKVLIEPVLKTQSAQEQQQLQQEENVPSFEFSK